MAFDQVIVLVLVAGAAAYLVRALWRLWTGKGGGCGSCGGCGK